jgi:eukaryotic-like serine/threonine-protein kinase
MSVDSPTARGALHNLCLADDVWAERYEGWAELGRGGSAHVVRAFSRATGEDVALKVFHHLTAEDAHRFQQEVRSAQRLTSPYIIRTYGAFPRGSLAWIEMELVDGLDLRQELDRRAADGSPFVLDEGLAVAQALASALAAAHEAGVVHRDVKPANVLLPAGGRPVAKLGDFGISRVLGATRVTATGLLTGTPQFAAPEVAAGEPARPASDVYSLALTAFLVFAGNRFPFPVPDDASAAQWLRAHRDQAAWPLRRLRPEAPETLEALLAAGLAKDPAARPSASEMLDGLTAVRGGRVTTVVPSLPEAPRRRVRAGWLLLAGALAAGVLGLYGLRTPVPAAVPAASAPASPPAASPAAEPSAAPAAPALETSLLPEAVAVLNAGPGAVTDLRVTLSGDRGESYVATAAGTLAPGEEVVMALDGFRPQPPRGWRPRKVDVASARTGP